GRPAPELAEVVGLFANTLVHRGDLRGDPTFRELLRRTRRTSLGGMMHQELPFGRVVAAVAPERELGRNPLVDVVFVHQETPSYAPEAEAAIEPWEHAGSSVARFDLELHTQVTGDGAGGAFIYKTDLFDRGTIERLARRWIRLLERVAERPDTPLSRLPLLDDEDTRFVLGASE